MTEKPAVLATRKLPEAVEARLARDYRARLNPDDAIYDTATILEKSAGCDALLVCPTERIDDDLVSKLPQRVRMIATFSVGYEHIDLGAAKQRGIIVTNTPDVLTTSTADLAMLLLLGTSRRAYEAEQILRAGQWGIWATTWMLGTDVAGKRLGILGMGRIGRSVAQRARGFDMDIHYHNRNRLPPEQEQGATYHASGEDLLPHSDFLSIHCPATPETRHWLNRERIEKLPQGAIVVNTARGAVVDDEALIAALTSGRLAAAGLDVYEGEPDINPGYRGIKNAMLLPHIGSATRETRNAMGFKCLDNLDAYFAGGEAPDRVA